jgi:multidrug efflux system outer membrane protein
MTLRILLTSFAVLLTGCTVGPSYRRPAVAIPSTFRAPAPLPQDQAASLADLKWFDVFEDQELQGLIRTALEQNYDLRDAVARVDVARAGLGIARSSQFPNVGAGGNVEINRLSRDGATALSPAVLPDQNRNFGTVSLALLSFEVDIWGRLRRATEGARAVLLGAEENRKGVVTTLVGDVATAYLTLRELDEVLDISERTLRTREQSLELTRSRQQGGVATLLDLRQAEQLVDTAAQVIPGIEQAIGQTENQIRLLLGESPGQVPRGRSLVDQRVAPEVPAGVPSELLERRPGHPRGGARSDRRQRRDRRGESSIFPAVESQRTPRRTEHAAGQSVQRAAWRVEPDAATDPADIHRRPYQVQRQTGGGGADPGTRSIRANHPDGIYRSLEQPDCPPESTRES